MRKEKYIQLPPIPEELDGNVVRMIWEYTKLPEKEQQFVYEQYKVLSDDSSSESDFNAVLIKPDHPEKIEEFGNNMKAVIAELFRETVGLAQYVYEECFVKKHLMSGTGIRIGSAMPGIGRRFVTLWKVLCGCRKWPECWVFQEA